MLFFMATNISCRDGVCYFRARVPTHLVSIYRDSSFFRAASQEPRAFVKAIQVSRGSIGCSIAPAAQAQGNAGVKGRNAGRELGHAAPTWRPSHPLGAGAVSTAAQSSTRSLCR